MNTESKIADHMWQYAPTPAGVSRNGRVTVWTITTKTFALATPAVKESWRGAGRRRGKKRNAHIIINTPDVFALQKGAMEQSLSLASALIL